MLVVSVLASLALRTSDALACGACTYPPTPTISRATAVMDHRMVLSLTSEQTVLWDQIRFSGDPRQFLWILPVADATSSSVEIAVGSSAFIDAIDEYSAPAIYAPEVRCSDGGVAVSPWSRADASAPGAIASQSSEQTALGSTRRAAVGPYAAELVRARDGSLATWLRDRGFAVGTESESIIRHYETMRFDFVVVQFRPGADVTQMEPIRISTRGYNPVLPLRFAAIGAGDNVGLTLMVVAESAMVPASWQTRTIDSRDIVWSVAGNASNYRALLASSFRGSEPPWILESASRATFSDLSLRATGRTMTASRLPDIGILHADCPFPDESAAPIRGPDLDGSADGAASDDDASAPTGDGGDPRCAPRPSSLAVSPSAPAPQPDLPTIAALMRSSRIVTRLHIRIGASAFARDLRLEPSLDEVAVERYPSSAVDTSRVCPTLGQTQPALARLDPGCRCATPGSTRAPSRSVLALAGVCAALALARQRRAPRKALAEGRSTSGSLGSPRQPE